MEKIGFFQESEGVNSSTRLIFVIGSLVTIGMSVGMIFYLKLEPITTAIFFSMIEGTLCTIKLYQNNQENKSIKTESNMNQYLFTYTGPDGSIINEPIWANTPEDAWLAFEIAHPGIHPISGPKKNN